MIFYSRQKNEARCRAIHKGSQMFEYVITLTNLLWFQDDCVDGDDGTIAMSSDREAEAPTHSCYGATGSYQCGTIHEGINQVASYTYVLYQMHFSYDNMHTCTRVTAVKLTGVKEVGAYIATTLVRYDWTSKSGSNKSRLLAGIRWVDVKPTRFYP